MNEAQLEFLTDTVKHNRNMVLHLGHALMHKGGRLYEWGEREPLDLDKCEWDNFMLVQEVKKPPL